MVKFSGITLIVCIAIGFVVICWLNFVIPNNLSINQVNSPIVSTQTDRAEYWALHSACESNDLATVQKIVQAYPDSIYYQYGSNHSSPLTIAAYTGSKDVVGFLLSVNSPIDYQTRDGRTALHAAVANKHNDIVFLLIRIGADLNIQDIDGFSPIHTAAFVNNADSLKALIEVGADCKLETIDGKTALEIAVDQSSKDCIELLE